MKALCTACLAPRTDVSTESITNASEGRPKQTVYCADDLAFPGIQVTAPPNKPCLQCGSTGPMIAVDPRAADVVERYLKSRQE